MLITHKKDIKKAIENLLMTTKKDIELWCIQFSMMSHIRKNVLKNAIQIHRMKWKKVSFKIKKQWCIVDYESFSFTWKRLVKEFNVSKEEDRIEKYNLFFLKRTKIYNHLFFSLNKLSSLDSIKKHPFFVSFSQPFLY